jgi:hypothetical protein
MDIKQLLRTRLAQLDPTIDTTDGSFADRVLLTPVTDALGPDPLSAPVRDFLVAKYAEAFPGMPLARGDAITDVLISAAEVFMSGYRQQLALLRNAQSVSRIDLLSDDDADALAANWFVGRAVGAPSTGVVTVVVDRVAQIAISSQTTAFLTAGGAQFVPTASEVVSAQRVSAGQVGPNRYAFDLSVVAVTPGAAGNIATGEIIEAAGISNLVSVTNAQPFVGGLTGDTTEGLLSTKLPRAISERSMVTARGIVARLSTTFATLGGIQVIGIDDPEMRRDLVDVRAFSDTLGAGVAYVLGRTALLSLTTDAADEARVGLSVKLRAADGRVVWGRVVDVLTDSAQSLLRRAVLSVWVRLDVQPGDGMYTAIACYPHAAILDGRQVGHELHLGGRVDIYVRPTDDTPIDVLTQTSAQRAETLYGTGVRLGHNDTLLLYGGQVPRDVGRCVLELDGTLYNVLHGERTIAGVLRVTLVGTGPSSYTPATPWALHRAVGVELTAARTRVFPIAPTDSLTVEGALGSEFVNAGGAISTLAVAGVARGDILVFGGSERVIDRVAGTRIYLATRLTQTVARIEAEIVRAQQTTPSPLGVIRQVALGAAPLAYARPLGVNVTSMGPEPAPHLTQRGFVAPSLFYALRAMADNSARPGHVLLENTLGGYSILQMNAQPDLRTGTDVSAYPLTLQHSRARSSAQPGASVIAAIGRKARLGMGDHEPILVSDAHEFELWNELFMPGTRNIFITQLDAGDDEAYYGATAPQRGDILRIYEGPNAGSYIIADSIQLEVQDTVAGLLVGHTKSTRRLDVTNAVADTRRFSCIKIYGEFPVRELEHVEQEIVLETHPTVTLHHTADDARFNINVRPLVLESFAAALAGQYRLGATARTGAAVMQGLRSLGETAPYGTIDDAGATSPLLTTRTTAESRAFAVLRAPTGAGKLYTEANDTCFVRAAAPSLVPLPVALRTISAAASDTYRVPDVSAVTWGETRAYVVDGQRDVYATPRRDMQRALLREPDLSHISTHDLLLPQDFVSPDVVVLPDMDPDILLDPCELLVHEEVYLTRGVNMSSAVVLFEYAPVTLAGAGMTQPQQEFHINLGGDSDVAVTVITREALRGGYTGVLSAVNAAGVSLADVINRYELFALRPAGAALGTDYALTDPGLRSARLRYLLQPEASYHVVTQTETTPTLALGVIGPSDYEVRILPQTPTSVVSLGDVPVGARVYVSLGGTEYVRSVSAVRGDTLQLDAPIARRAAEVRAYGRCVVDLNTGFIQLGTSSDFAIDGTLTATDAPNTYLYQGGASRPFLSTDVGLQITLWGVTGSYPLADALPEGDAVREHAYAPVRQHLGSARVIHVASETAISPTRGTQYVTAQTVRCDRSPWRDALPASYELTLQDGLLECAYVLTDNSVALPEGADVAALCTVQVYEQAPEVYHIAGRQLNGDGAVLLTTRRGDTRGPSEIGISSVFEYTDVGGVSVLSSFDLRNPYNVRTLRARGDLSLVCAQQARPIVGQTAPVTHAGGDGFLLHDADAHAARGARERLQLRVNANAASRFGADMALNALYSPLVAQAQSVVSARTERTVCSDSQVRRMASGYVGVTLRYEGGPAEQVVGQRISDVLNTALAQGAAFGVADLVALVVNMGAARVETPVEMYVCVEDMSRVRHRREILDILSVGQLLHVDVTRRILSVQAAPLDTALLGARIVVTRGTGVNTTIGSGGA